MAITGQRLLTELGHKAWSGFNADDMTWADDESVIARTELNGALRYLFSLSDFPFKESVKKFKTVSNKNSYGLPYGQISEVYLIDGKNRKKLVFAPETAEKENGTPQSYSIAYVEQDVKLKLYPTPDSNYQIEVKYNKLEPVIDSNGNTKFEFEYGTDFINMPDSIAYYFMDCLVLKTMEQNNKDNQDENYQPIINEFNERWDEFKKMARPVKTETRVVWL